MINEGVERIDLEEGELLSSGGEETPDCKGNLGCDDYVVAERPTSWSKAIVHPGIVTGGGLSSKLGEVMGVQCVTGFNPVIDNFSDADFESEPSSSDDSDSNDNKKRRMTMTGFEQNTQPSPGTSMETSAIPSSSNSGELDAFKEEANKLQLHRRKKPNNIWANVIQDEEVAGLITKIGVQQHESIERGPESYVLRNVLKRKRTLADSESSSITSGGLSDESKDYLRICGSPPSSMKSFPIDDHTPAVQQSSRNACLSRKKKKRKKRRSRKVEKERVLRKLTEVPDVCLGNYIAQLLNEPKRQIIQRVVGILGRENCIRLYMKTMKIERRGGLLIRNHLRRRTPGGVFLYLLRGDNKLEQNLVDEIFKGERMFDSKAKKRENSKRRRNRRVKLMALKQEAEKRDGSNGGICEKSEEGDDSEELSYSSGLSVEAQDKDDEDEDYLDITCDPSDLIQ